METKSTHRTKWRRRSRLETKSTCGSGSGGGDRGSKPSRPRDQVAAATAAGNQVDQRVKGAVAIVWKPGRPPGQSRRRQPRMETESPAGSANWSRRTRRQAAGTRGPEGRRRRIVEMIAHVVLFKPKHELTTAQRQAVIDDLKAAAAAYPHSPKSSRRQTAPAWSARLRATDARRLRVCRRHRIR